MRDTRDDRDPGPVRVTLGGGTGKSVGVVSCTDWNPTVTKPMDRDERLNGRLPHWNSFSVGETRVKDRRFSS